MPITFKSRLLVALGFAVFGVAGTACSGSGFSGAGATQDAKHDKPETDNGDGTSLDQAGTVNTNTGTGTSTAVVSQNDGTLPDQPIVTGTDILSAIDTTCASGQGGGGGGIGDVLFGGGVPVAPKVDLPEQVEASCHHGLEFNNYEGRFELKTKGGSGQGPVHRPLDLDIASYTVADRMRLLARTASGQEVLILDSCRLRTAEYTDPTNGASRPPDDSVREFRTHVPADTTALIFDFSGAGSPTYMKVDGLCDFDLIPTGGALVDDLRTF